MKVAPSPDLFSSKTIQGQRDIAALRRGEFHLIDPKGGHPHWMGRPDTSVQKFYLKEIQKAIPDSGTVAILRSIITKGVEHTVAGLRANNENMALLSALLLSVCVSESHIDDPAGMCQMRNVSGQPGLGDDGIGKDPHVLCNEQANAAAVGAILCLLTMVWCIANIGYLNFLSSDSAAYHILITRYNYLAIPAALIFSGCFAFGWALTTRVGLQKALYTPGFAGHTNTHFLWSWCFVALMFWAVAGLLGVFCSGVRTVREGRQRDLDPTGEGVSDSFLRDLGLLEDGDADEGGEENLAGAAKPGS